MCKKNIKILSILILLIILLSITLGAYANYLPQKITASVEDNKLYFVKYENFTISVKRIRTDSGSMVLYCLEIDKGYPANNEFYLSKEPEEAINSIIASGYPSKMPEELGLEDESQAYFATQIAIWSYIEGYDVNKITGDNINILEAIREIYDNGILYYNDSKTINRVYMSDNNSIQNLLAATYQAQLG